MNLLRQIMGNVRCFIASVGAVRLGLHKRLFPHASTSLEVLTIDRAPYLTRDASVVLRTPFALCQIYA
jgi:hypothetical protein